MGMDQELYRFRAIIGHQGPLLASDPDWKGSKYNVQVEWETGEITFEPLSIIAADDHWFLPLPISLVTKTASSCKYSQYSIFPIGLNSSIK